MTISRRDFSKAGLGAGGLLLCGSHIGFTQPPTLLTKKIPSSGEAIPVIGVGTNRYGVGNDAELRAPLKAALQTFHSLGGTVVDTAPGYRSAETVLGDLTRELGITDDLFMATKVDVEGSAASIERMRRSATRLNKDPIDLMQVHNFIGWESALARMQERKKDGQIRYIGITTSRERQYSLMETVMKNHSLDFIQVNYSLANQRSAADRLLPLAADRGIAVLINRPFGGGRAFGALAKATMPAWASDFGVTSWGQFLLKYVLSHPSVTCAIPGMTKKRHVIDNLGAAAGRMPDTAERRRMEAFFAEV